METQMKEKVKEKEKEKKENHCQTLDMKVLGDKFLAELDLLNIED